jgi:hypothetical protein
MSVMPTSCKLTKAPGNLSRCSREYDSHNVAIHPISVDSPHAVEEERSELLDGYVGW